MLWLSLERSSTIPLIKQIYHQVRERILRGELTGGYKLPSTRQLATDLHISRTVVLEAYDQLLAEGYIESRAGSGMYITSGIMIQAWKKPEVAPLIPDRQVEKTLPIDFRSGIPALDLFPRKTWGQLARETYTTASVADFNYDRPEGRYGLRLALTRYLSRSRGITCSPEQIIITAGAAQAYSLLTRALLSQGDCICVEDPSTADIKTILTETGAGLWPIPVDAQGLQTEYLPADRCPRLVITTPSHQFPLGGLLPVQRRIQLLEFARATNCYLVEDDYDSEFRYSGPPISSFQELAPDRVIYIGTFSKILAPSLRLGYMILPGALVEAFRRQKRLTDIHAPSCDQLILARFIEEGYLERHIMKMRRIYGKRRETLIQNLHHYFADRVTISGTATGIHLVAHFQQTVFTSEVLQTLEQAGVRIYPVGEHALLSRERYDGQCILGYGHLDQPDLIEGVKRMHQVLIETA